VLTVQLHEHIPSEHSNISPLYAPMSQIITDIPVNVCVEAGGDALFSNSGAYSRQDAERETKMFRSALLSLMVPDQSLNMCRENLITSPDLEAIRSLGNCDSELTTASSISEDLVMLFHGLFLMFQKRPRSKKGRNSLPTGNWIICLIELHGILEMSLNREIWFVYTQTARLIGLLQFMAP
jgi:hypothetical protein